MTIVALMCIFTNGEAAKKYKWDSSATPIVEQTGVASDGYFVKAWGVASNADKAMEKARMDAVHAALFCGISQSQNKQGRGTGELPALVDDAIATKREDFFRSFFSSGKFLEFVSDVSSTYPKGADNVKTPQGRRVGLQLVLHYDSLRKYLQEEGVVKTLGEHFTIE